MTKLKSWIVEYRYGKNPTSTVVRLTDNVHKDTHELLAAAGCVQA